VAHSLPWWLLPTAAALVLVATHTYLGLHVISRNVFFVDLALAQIAAFGGSLAFLYGYEASDAVTYYVSLGFATLGAWFFSVARLRDERVPQEAIIGLSFAVASAGSILLSAEHPHGAEHLRDMMAGSILMVSAEEVARAAALYAGIGLFHWIFRRPLLAVSMDRDAAEKAGTRVRLWDFLFYLSFAVVITSSVRIAGVLLVFILLIAPAVAGAMFAKSTASRLLIGWGAGALATGAGLMLSARMDYPPAPAISAVFALVLGGAAVVGQVVRAPRRGAALARLLGAALAFVAAGSGLIALLRSGVGSSTAEPEPTRAEPAATEQSVIAALKDERDDVRAGAARALGKRRDPAALPHLIDALEDPSDAVKENAARSLGELGSAAAKPALERALERTDQDEWVKLRVAEALACCGATSGIWALLQLAADADAKLVSDQALLTALELTGHSSASGLQGAEAEARLAELRRWWETHGPELRWSAERSRFIVDE
jgi:zinc/manganese transport system permease protein